MTQIRDCRTEGSPADLILAFDDLLRKFDMGNITSIGYADDGSLIVCGQRLDALFKELNVTLQKTLTGLVNMG